VKRVVRKGENRKRKNYTEKSGKEGMQKCHPQILDGVYALG